MADHSKLANFFNSIHPLRKLATYREAVIATSAFAPCGLHQNEYDAAAMFLTTDTVDRLSHGADSPIALIDLVQITNQRLHLMNRPDVVVGALQRAFAAADD